MTQWGLDSLFNPAKRHMDEEKRRLQSTREEIGDSSGGDRIDLASGKVVIRRKKDAPAADRADDAADDAGEDAGDDGAVDDSGVADEHVDQTAQAENAPTTGE